MKLMLMIQALIFSLIFGCTEQHIHQSNATNTQDETQWVKLTDGHMWQIASDNTDPFRASIENRTLCGITDFGEEYGGVEVSTQRCDYITLTQPLLFDVMDGSLLELNLWHSPLLSDELSQGMIVLQVDQTVLWIHELSIPAPAQSWTVQFPSPISMKAGTPLIFHVRNHGANSYTLHHLSVVHP
jgi:hypothetical protein